MLGPNRTRLPRLESNYYFSVTSTHVPNYYDIGLQEIQMDYVPSQIVSDKILLNLQNMFFYFVLPMIKQDLMQLECVLK